MRRVCCFISIALTLSLPGLARAQDEAEVQPPGAPTKDKTDLGSAPNQTAGEFTPAKGFDIVKTDLGSLNISFYGLARYLDQLPASQEFVDHLGRTRGVDARNDINWQRTMIWFSGFALNPRLVYVLTVWSLPATQQTLAFGNLQFKVADGLTIGAGIGPTLTARSMTGSHPFWAASDRQMGEEFFRGGFSSGAWVRGEPIPGLFYWLSVNANLSQLGVVAANDSRFFSYSGSLWWEPTTGEFGQRGGLADFEEHDHLATRFGTSMGHARENRAADLTASPNATQLRLSDGVLLFETGSLAPGVTVEYANYDILAYDVGLKYRGWSFQGEYYLRWLSHFDATGPLPMSSIFDTGFMAETMYMFIPKYLGVYASGTYIWDAFQRHPWEGCVGASYFPFATRSFRLNLHTIYVHKSPTGSTFGYYAAGQTGEILSLGADVLF